MNSDAADVQAELKTFFSGTHRLVDPAATWTQLQGVLPIVGVTRVADVTDLDPVRIPVALAIRPAARTVAVSAGKGIERLQAKVGAAMEAVEVWHAERALPAEFRATVAAAGVPYPVDSLPLAPGSMVERRTLLDWCIGRGLISGRTIAVPRDLVLLDYTVSLAWSPPLFLPSSNGLASGNSLLEATCHALLEVIERDSLQRFNAMPSTASPVDLGSVGDAAVQTLLARLVAAENAVRLLDITSVTGIPCYRAEIRDRGIPLVFVGSGCHTDAVIAACRAITEAVQSRIGMILGSRDDLDEVFYLWSSDPARLRSGNLPESAAGPCQSGLKSGVATPSISGDVELLAQVVEDVTGFEPIAVDLSCDGCPIPVTKLIAPGLAFGGASTYRGSANC